VANTSTRSLSITWERAKVEHVHAERLQDMWGRAERLLGTPGFVLSAAGGHIMSRQVVNLSGQGLKDTSPHFVYAEHRKI